MYNHHLEQDIYKHSENSQNKGNGSNMNVRKRTSASIVFHPASELTHYKNTHDENGFIMRIQGKIQHVNQNKIRDKILKKLFGEIQSEFFITNC